MEKNVKNIHTIVLYAWMKHPFIAFLQWKILPSLAFELLIELATHKLSCVYLNIVCMLQVVHLKKALKDYLSLYNVTQKNAFLFLLH